MSVLFQLFHTDLLFRFYFCFVVSFCFVGFILRYFFPLGQKIETGVFALSCSIFETGLHHYSVQAGLEFMICLPQASRALEYSSASPLLAYILFISTSVHNLQKSLYNCSIPYSLFIWATLRHRNLKKIAWIIQNLKHNTECSDPLQSVYTGVLYVVITTLYKNHNRKLYNSRVKHRTLGSLF